MNKIFFAFVFSFAVFFICAAGAPEQLNKLMIEPYRHFSVIASYGLRSLQAVDQHTLKLEIGISCGNNYFRPQSYLIVSFDDDAYSPYMLVQPRNVSVKRILEAEGLPGSLLDSFYRTEVTVDLPFPMKKGCVYTVTAQEYNGVAMTAARDGVSCRFGAESVESSVKEEVNLKVLGLRGINPIGNGCVQLSFGPAVDYESLSEAVNYHFKINGEKASPEIISTRRVVESYLPEGTPYKRILRTDVFINLGRPFADGDTITLEVPGKVCSAWNRAELVFDSSSVVSSSFHTDAFGYILEEPVRSAYIAKWMASLPGVWLNDRPGAGFMGGADGLPPDLPGVKPLSISFKEPPVYTVVNQNSGEKVFSGTAVKLEKPSMLEAMEAIDLPHENVYLADLSSIKEPGWYFIYSEGIGRSLPFEVKDEHFSNAAQLLSRTSFMNIVKLKAPPPGRIVYGKPWWTNLWSYDPFTVKRLTAWKKLDYNPPEYGLDFGNAPVMIGGKAWYTNVWSYNPYDIKHLTAWKHLDSLTPPDYGNRFTPPTPAGAKAWYTNVWSYDPYDIKHLTDWKDLPVFTPPSSVNSYDPSIAPWYDEYIRKYRDGLDARYGKTAPYEYAP